MIVLQTMTEYDVSRITAIESQLYFRPWSEKSFLHACNNYLSYLFIQEEEFIGYAIVDKIGDESQLLNFSIVPKYQNQGLGQQALCELIRYFYESWQIKIIYLEVNALNHSAIHIYKKLGFTVMGRRLGYYTVADGKEDAITMYHSKDMMVA